MKERTDTPACPPGQDRAYFERQIRDCLERTRNNQQLFDLETEPELIDAHIYRGLSLQCEYRYLMRRVRETEAEACKKPRRRKAAVV